AGGDRQRGDRAQGCRDGLSIQRPGGVRAYVVRRHLRHSGRTLVSASQRVGSRFELHGMASAVGWWRHGDAGRGYRRKKARRQYGESTESAFNNRIGDREIRAGGK